MDNFGSIMGDSEVLALLDDNQSSPTNDGQSPEKDEKNNDNDKQDNITEIVDPLSLLDGGQVSEGVGNEGKAKEDTEAESSGGSPNNSFSSIAKALAETGIFPNFTEDIIKDIRSQEDLISAMEKHKKDDLDSEVRRVKEALDAGVDSESIRQYENTLKYLDSITEEQLQSEKEESETLRKNLIYQDFINKGFSQEKARQMMERSFEAGKDIEDAKEALKNNKDHFRSEYDSIVNESKKKKEEEERNVQVQIDKLKESIMSDSKVFGDLELDNRTRQKICDNLIKPVFKGDDGKYYTSIQKFQKENPVEFQKFLGLCFTLTDGFKSVDGLFRQKLNKEKTKIISGLESLINNTSRASDGSIKFVSDAEDTESSFLGKNTRFAF